MAAVVVHAINTIPKFVTVLSAMKFNTHVNHPGMNLAQMPHDKLVITGLALLFCNIRQKKCERGI